MHRQYDMIDDMGIFPWTNDDDKLVANVMGTGIQSTCAQP